MVIIFIPCSTRKEALRIGKVLLKERLVGCVNVLGPSESLFWGSPDYRLPSTDRRRQKIKQAREYILLLKTVHRLAGRVERRVRALHSYSVPCIARIKVAKVNAGYAKWLRSVVR